MSKVVEGKFDDRASVRCPSCKTPLRVPRVYAASGKKFECLKCRKKLILRTFVKHENSEVIEIDR